MIRLITIPVQPGTATDRALMLQAQKHPHAVHAMRIKKKDGTHIAERCQLVRIDITRHTHAYVFRAVRS